MFRLSKGKSPWRWLRAKRRPSEERFMDTDSEVSELSDTNSDKLDPKKMDERDVARRRSIEIAQKFAEELEHEGSPEAAKQTQQTSSKPRKRSFVNMTRDVKASVMKTLRRTRVKRKKNKVIRTNIPAKAGGKEKKFVREDSDVESEEREEAHSDYHELTDDESSFAESYVSVEEVEAELFKGSNEWRSSEHELFFCTSDQDNVAQKHKWRDFNIFISQNRESHKTQGQDCVGTAAEKNWEIVVLCDGHDKDGLHVASGICKTLPHFLLRRIVAREMIDAEVEDQIFIDAFAEAENTVAWVADYLEDEDYELDYGEYCKLTEGEYAGEIGYIAVHERGDEEATVVVESKKLGYNRINVPVKSILTPRYHGGSTCVCFVRNVVSNECRVAILGDSRLMVLSGQEGLFGDDDEDVLFVAGYISQDDRFNDEYELRPLAFFTPQHCVHNNYEIARLKASEDHEFRIDMAGGYLINPTTQFKIQPTRGFGDVMMHGTGYSKLPEISNTFVLPENSVLVAASDGIFDGDIWEDDSEFCTQINKYIKEGKSGFEIADSLYAESIKRCMVANSRDDISLVVLKTSGPEVSEAGMTRTRLASDVKKKSKSFKRKRSTKGSIKKLRRSTIARITKTRNSVTGAMSSRLRRSSFLSAARKTSKVESEGEVEDRL